jgi:hypothetical protein
MHCLPLVVSIIASCKGLVAACVQWSPAALLGLNVDFVLTVSEAVCIVSSSVPSVVPPCLDPVGQVVSHDEWSLAQSGTTVFDLLWGWTSSDRNRSCFSSVWMWRCGQYEVLIDGQSCAHA